MPNFTLNFYHLVIKIYNIHHCFKRTEKDLTTYFSSSTFARKIYITLSEDRVASEDIGSHGGKC